jgi:uncharacterized protein (DUF4415 family)
MIAGGKRALTAAWQDGGPSPERPMTDRKRTKREERSYADLMRELHELESWNQDRKLKARMIPPDWRKLDRTAPCRPRKTRITAAFDAEVVKWYRGLGHGYQTRMNAVLRAYMHAVIAKEIERTGDRDWKGDLI